MPRPTVNNVLPSLLSRPDEIGLCFDAIGLGLIIIPPGGTGCLVNKMARLLLSFSEDEKGSKFSLSRVLQAIGAGVLAEGEAEPRFNLRTPGGRFLELRIGRDQLERVVISLCEAPPPSIRDEQWQRIAIDYDSLFKHALCGVHRRELDGTPLSCNVVLARMHGYETEEDYLQALRDRPSCHYADPSRLDELHQLLETQGHVKDFTSLGVRHRNGENFWMTENIWYVRDESGRPFYIESTIHEAVETRGEQGLPENQTSYDSLTGTISRQRFFNELDYLTGPQSEGCTLLMIDIDHFKEVNDALGHEAGDTVLKAVASRIGTFLPDGGILARVGGDEFAILIPAMLHEDEAAGIASRIVDAMDEPVEIRNHAVAIGLSIGVAVYPSLAVDFDELLGNATSALRAAKIEGRHCFRLFGASMRAAFLKRRVLTEELGRAIPRGEFVLHFQPIVAGGVSRVQSVEALLRWNHPQRGLLLPGEFLSLVEEKGLTVDIGAWVLANACKQAMALPPHMQVAVNVSAGQLRSPDAVDLVRQALQSSGLAPNRLTLEITESAILSSEIAAKRVLDRLSSMGIAIALDDFGTANSSLSYLQRFSFDKVKIDRAFVSGMMDIPADMAVVRAVIGIGRDLGIEVIAEGVESRLQVDRLIREGCPHMQGHYFGRPEPMERLLASLTQSEIEDIPLQKLRFQGRQ